MLERRLVFGEVADLYDRHRPAYPDRLIDDLVSLAGLDGRRAVLEVGAGTGKATSMFAARGIPMLAVEPSAQMGAVARANLLAYPAVEIEQSDFEDWDPAGRDFPLVFSGQAWHWVRPAAGYARARAALSAGGLFAAFWNRPAWGRSRLREPLLDAYRQAATELTAENSTMHPANLDPVHREDWVREIAAADGLGGAENRYYRWSQDYSADEYVGLLQTTSEVRLLPEQQHTALLGAVHRAISQNGGELTLALETRLCLARRTD